MAGALLVTGPARIRAISGPAEILGMVLRQGAEQTVPRGRSLPLAGSENCEVELGEGASAREVVEAYPAGWSAVDRLLGEGGRVIFLGRGDAGKSTLTTLAANLALRRGMGVAVINKDPGQADIAPPTTVSLAVPSSPFADLSGCRPAAMYFVGRTSPQGATRRMLTGLALLERERARIQGSADRIGAEGAGSVSGRGVLLVNSSGWVDGAALDFRIDVIDLLGITDVVLLEAEGELEGYAKALSSMRGPRVRVTRLPALRGVLCRSRQARRERRRESYRGYFEGARVRELRLEGVAVRRPGIGILWNWGPPAGQAEEGGLSAGGEGKGGGAGKDGWAGRLVGLCGSDGLTLGLGVVKSVSAGSAGASVGVLTPVTGEVAELRCGEVFLDGTWGDHYCHRHARYRHQHQRRR